MMEDMDKELDRLVNQLSTKEQIDRILNALTLDPYSILDLPHSSSTDAVKQKYRAISRQIHPDKTKLEGAAKAFDLLKKSESILMDPEQREKLDDVYKEAEIQSQQQGLDIDAVYKELLIKDEFKKRMHLKREMERQGNEEKLKEDSIKFAKEKKAANDKWEDERDDRVKSWRAYKGKVDKKKTKKKKVKVLA